MATVEIPHCRGPVPPNSSRYLLAGTSDGQPEVASTWKNLLHAKLEELKLSVGDNDRIQYNLPSTTTSSPDVQVRIWIDSK